ncbi:hypothetical protein [Candidatus Magnetomonas plexicatena]|uniref:hypothetical protein n=1 Tax=Candidatus Magnetomonas plexicatena TaxID=2552947 RepID=UPI001C791286|nr:hypothetical protein E2O03_015080 [Nitrospirales bacterium LBB_01]
MAFVLSAVFVPVAVSAGTPFNGKQMILTLDICKTTIAGVHVTDIPVVIEQMTETILFNISEPKRFQSFTSHKPVLLTEISHPPQSA